MQTFFPLIPGVEPADPTDSANPTDSADTTNTSGAGGAGASGGSSAAGDNNSNTQGDVTGGDGIFLSNALGITRDGLSVVSLLLVIG